MCLGMVDKKMECRASGYGYKVFDFYREYRYGMINLRFKHKSYLGSVEVPVNKWIETDQPRAFLGYSPNFHIFRYKKDAEANRQGREVVVKVKYRKANCTGTQRGKTIIVAQELYVPWKEGK